MDRAQKEEIITRIKKDIVLLQYLSIELDISETVDKQEYSSEDLFAVSSLFIHIMGNISATYQSKKGLTDEQVCMVAEEIGNNLRQTMLLGTGIDMHALVERLSNKS